MTRRTTRTLSLALFLGLVAGCSGSPEQPSPTAPSTSDRTPSAAPTLPPQVDATPGEPALVLWIAVQPSSEDDEAFALTIQQLADVGYDVVPMDLACQEGAAQALGITDTEGARGIGLVLSDLQAVDDFAMSWNGNMVGSFEGPLLCAQPAR